MIYQELFRTEIEAENLKAYLKHAYKKKYPFEAILADFQKNFHAEIEKKVVTLSPQQDHFEREFLLAKQQLLEMRIWLNLFYEGASEILPSFSHISPLELARQKELEWVNGLIAKLLSLEPDVLRAREMRLKPLNATQLELGLANMHRPFQAVLKGEKDPEKKKIVESFLQQQREALTFISDFINSTLERWEHHIIHDLRGFLIFDSDRFPFRVFYTILGEIYAIYETNARFPGVEPGLIGCRAVNLRSGHLLDTLELQTEFPEVKKKKDAALVYKKNFSRFWKESEILVKFIGKAGVLQLKDRLCFEIGKRRKLYLFEEHISEETLEIYFHRLWEKKMAAPPLPPSQKLLVARQLLTGLKQIHAAKIIHGDLQPKNIFLNLGHYEVPIAFIASFHASYPVSTPTDSLQIDLGGFGCPPEFARIIGDKYQIAALKEKPELLYKADVWSMGCILYHLFFDAPLPWEKGGEKGKYQRIAELKRGWIPSIYQNDPHFSLVEKMLEIDPVKRPTAEEALRDC